MSGVVLASAASREPTVRPDEALRQVLPGPPVASRSFPQNDDVAMFVEDAAKPIVVPLRATIAQARELVCLEASVIGPWYRYLFSCIGGRR